MIGRFGAGYFGQWEVPLGSGRRDVAASQAAQIVGVRYWFPRMRLDVGFGWNAVSGKDKYEGEETDIGSLVVLVGRVSLPFAIYSEEHYTFFLGPDVTYGRSRAMQPSGSPNIANSTHTGSRLSLGARAGAEIQFGFIGLPRLSLDATVSLSLDMISGNSVSSPDSSTRTVESAYERTLVRSSAEHQPWNIFVSNVAAVYYF